ncbi:hypothetical protein V6N13_103579 [Hibiscus sabdariffa]|uniref:RAB6-interacting golgin n=1 Tax=Hibiscus sabdariffa TaxID=183260 RepID=A0ABR2N7B7_9ROSI
MMQIEQQQQQPQPQPSQQQNQLTVQNSGSLSFSSHLSKEDEEISKSALSTFRAKEEEIERKKMAVREKVQLQLGRVEEETKRLAVIREELEALADPMRKEVAQVRKKIDAVNKELKPLGHTCQKKEREYKEALEAFNEKNKEKVQLITKLMELVSESERLRMKKLEEITAPTSRWSSVKVVVFTPSRFFSPKIHYRVNIRSGLECECRIYSISPKGLSNPITKFVSVIPSRDSDNRRH